MAWFSPCRGDDDLKVEEWLWILQQQAEASGGAVYHLLGNHEVDQTTCEPFDARMVLFRQLVLRGLGSHMGEKGR